MPLIKLTRINKGGDIVINSDHIAFVEIEDKSTTVHLAHNLLFSVQESPEGIAALVEQVASARIKNAIVESGLAARPVV